ncbi:potassium-transporting ATPase subunit KdpC [Neisseriaceae bacterium CLB008]
MQTNHSLLRPAVSVLVFLSLLLGVVYPLSVTALGQWWFPQQAAGSLVWREGKVIGSALIGQNFIGPEYFWGRPSGAGDHAYNSLASGGANLGPSNPRLTESVAQRLSALAPAGAAAHSVPVDLVTHSASGLDPDISLAAAEYQVPRVAQARALDEAQLRALIAEQAVRSTWLFGENRINVLLLNDRLDQLAKPTP